MKISTQECLSFFFTSATGMKGVATTQRALNRMIFLQDTTQYYVHRAMETLK